MVMAAVLLVLALSVLLLALSLDYLGAIDGSLMRFILGVIYVTVFTAGILAWAALRDREKRGNG